MVKSKAPYTPITRQRDANKQREHANDSPADLFCAHHV